MKKVLYVSNIEVPYRVRLFNELAKHCDLTVLYERSSSPSRNRNWSESEKPLFKTVFSQGIKIGGENAFSLKAVSMLFKGYDEIIIGCFNSPVQMLMILLLRLLKKQYILNIDGEFFADGKSLKSALKRFFLKGASRYLVAGVNSGNSLRAVVGEKEIIPYYFSSLTDEELKKNAESNKERENFVLVVGQHLFVKGIDVALESAKMNKEIKYKFIGMGSQMQSFIEKYCPQGIENVEFIPFLQKEELEKEYRKCAVFVLPSRQECWGLVINEAASYGTPIVSTRGSGAALEFLSEEYPQYLASAGDAKALYGCIEKLLNSDNAEYCRYLTEKSKKYSIENGVKAHITACRL